jgi:hypothetical protein
MSDNSRQWTLHYRSHSLTFQLRLCCSDTVLATQQTVPTEQSGYCYMCCSRIARAIHLAIPVINKKVEGNYIPPMPGLKSGEN